MEHKINIYFCSNGFEVGYAEIGNYQNGHNTDRYLDNGMLKLPKQLKDMMTKMVKARLDLIISLKTYLSIVSLGNEIYLAVMDNPAGSTKVLYFPIDLDRIVEGFTEQPA
ncbi:hypothetical protein AB4K20DRAFT_1943785 [Rhizopus microsporus]